MDFWYDISSTDVQVTVRVYRIPNLVNINAPRSEIYEESIATTDPEAGWQHYELPELNVSPDSAIIRVQFTVEQSDSAWQSGAAHTVYLDDVNLTCSLLDTGSDPDDPPGGGGGGKDKPFQGESMPLLSGFKVYPNPFNPATRISFQLGRKTMVKLKMFDPRGRLVKTVINRVLPAGQQSFVWNGTNNRGARVASGIYFYRLEIEEIERKGKLVLLR
jgi:hypothetical protein